MLHVLIASWVVPSLGLSIVDAPWEARRSNILRVTGQPCDECSSMEDFYKDNELVFLLFYQRDLVSHHAYKGAIIAGFHEACKDLRWSRVACGIVDMLEDKAYAEKYIDPKTAPAHIAVRAGEPVPSKEEWIKKLLAKPGDKATELGSGQAELDRMQQICSDFVKILPRILRNDAANRCLHLAADWCRDGAIRRTRWTPLDSSVTVRTRRSDSHVGGPWKDVITSVPGADLTVQSRLQEFRQNAMPNWVPIFTKTGDLAIVGVSEVYLLVWVLLRLSVPEAWTKPACEDMHMWSLVVSLVGLRLVCQPDAHSSKWQRRFMSTTFSIASMLSQVDMPKQLGHVNGVAYAATTLFIGDPWFGLGVYAACKLLRPLT
ncbi:unnamed protein product [Durusdinium trenchii]|uniref:Uncharacterized protein n=1 Tax=Durusdinium trenchii TaxID=1381693 RepID=A0ABP0P352_9DINO